MTTPRSPLFALFLCLALAGCETTAPEQHTPTPTPRVDLPQSPASTSNALPLKPLAPATWRIEYTEGKLKGKTFDVRLAEAGGGKWIETTTGVRSMTMMQRDGAIVMPREEDVSENVAITYDPPFVLLPASFKPGEPFRGETTMTVDDLKSGARRDSGRCRYTVEFLGVERVETPAGAFDAHRFKTVRQIDLSLAKVGVTIETDHVPDLGIVRTRVEQKTLAIGIFSSTKVEESRLAPSR